MDEAQKRALEQIARYADQARADARAEKIARARREYSEQRLSLGTTGSPSIRSPPRRTLPKATANLAVVEKDIADIKAEKASLQAKVARLEKTNGEKATAIARSREQYKNGVHSYRAAVRRRDEDAGQFEASEQKRKSSLENVCKYVSDCERYMLANINGSGESGSAVSVKFESFCKLLRSPGDWDLKLRVISDNLDEWSGVKGLAREMVTEHTELIEEDDEERSR